MRLIVLVGAALAIAGCQQNPQLQRLGQAMVIASAQQTPAPVPIQQRCYYRSWGGQIIQQCW